MRSRSWMAALALLAIGLAPMPAAGQEATPGVVTMRYYQCGLGDLADAVELLNGTWREVADELVEEGVILGYGVLTHAWGDEWNLVDYIAAADMNAFQAGWTELLTRYQARDRDGSDLDELSELCPTHKDNIYSVIPPR